MQVRIKSILRFIANWNNSPVFRNTTSEYVDELEKIGHTEIIELKSVTDEQNYFYIHRSCAVWSFGVVRNADGGLNNLRAVVVQSLQRKCSFCIRFGASLICKVSHYTIVKY